MTTAYIAKRPDCGCVTAIICEGYGIPQKDIGKEVAGWIRDGRVVEHVDLEDGVQRLQSCPHGKAAATALANQGALL